MKDLLKSVVSGFGTIIGIAIGMCVITAIEDIGMKIRKAKDE